MRMARIALMCCALTCCVSASATIFGSVRGIIHDPQHRPVTGAMVMLRAKSSEWAKNGYTNNDGEFEFTAVPVGEYYVEIANPGYQQASQAVVVSSETEPVVHFQLSLAVKSETVNVSAAPAVVATDSATPETLISRSAVQQTPGADRTNSLSMITNYVPGAYLSHDQLHMRGGHQFSWLVDGVPVPNTNNATNVGPQFDPKDIDYMEVERGSYEAEYGDRTYGIFNVVPRTGFERNNQAELVTSFGNFYQTNDQISFGSHTQRFAYYASVNGNRSDLGLETPVAQIYHDDEYGYGGFGSVIFNVDNSNQLRFVTSLRRDFYEIPNTPEQQFVDSVRDTEHEADAFANFSWVHTFKSKMVMTISPFYHYNSANYGGGPNDVPVSTTDDLASNYGGAQVTFSANTAHNTFTAGFYGFGQHDNQLFGLAFNDASGTNFRDSEMATGGVESFFLEDKLKPTSWLTLMGGIRPTHFSGSISENAVSPRFGLAVAVPHLKWVFRAFYGHYYQPPPLLTASGPLLDFVTSQNLGFIPLRGERDEEHQFGVTIPLRGWTIDADTFETLARNFFDHNSVGNSNIFFPLTIERARINGWELTLRSPRIAHRLQVHLAYSNQVALAAGAVSGGLTDFEPPTGFFPLDHDQRNTLSVGGEISLPGKAYASTNVAYGSGFTNGEPPPTYLPGHTTFDLSLGKDFGEKYSLSLNMLNVANRHLLIDNSETFGGTHWNNPREIYAEFRYRFRY